MAGALEGATAVVTGASSGIGEATARALAAAGAPHRRAAVNEMLVRPTEQVR